MNSACLSGRLGADPQVRKTSGGKDVCNFSLAVKRPHVKDTIDWIDFEAWEATARYIASYGRKGCTVEVAGELKTEKYETPDGGKRSHVKVRVRDCRVYSNGERNGEGRTTGDTEYAKAQRTQDADLGGFRDAYADEEDMPF